MIFSARSLFKPFRMQLTFVLIFLMSYNLGVSGHTNATNTTQANTRLNFDPHELYIEQDFQGTVNVNLSGDSIPTNDSITFHVTCDEDGVIFPCERNITLSHKLNLTFTAISAGRTVMSAKSPYEPYSYVKVKTEAYVLIKVYYSKVVYTLSDVVGWIYFVFWTTAFYPQIVSNYKRKSVVGLDFNFLALNFLGHTSYDIFNIGLFWIPTIQTEYKAKFPRTGVIPVRMNDVGFSMHAVFATALTILQCLIYERGSQTISYTCMGLLTGMITFLLVTLGLAIGSVISWLDYLYYFSYIKLAITFMKNVPQVYYNYKRKSTEGFSIWTILLDFAGGLLSMVQMFMLAYNFNDWASFFGDISKFGLGILSVAFDVVYMVQHYIVYRKPYVKTKASFILQRTESDSKRKSYSNIYDVKY